MAAQKRSCLVTLILIPVFIIGLVLGIGAFMTVLWSFMNPIYFARGANGSHDALLMVQKVKEFKGNLLFHDAKHLYSMWIGAGILCLLNQFICAAVLTPEKWPVVLALASCAGSYTLLILPYLKLKRMLPATMAACNDPAQWPVIEGLNLFNVYGGNSTAPKVAIAGCQSMKTDQYWAISLIASTSFWCGIFFATRFVLPPVWSTMSFLGEYLSEQARQRRSFKEPEPPSDANSSAGQSASGRDKRRVTCCTRSNGQSKDVCWACAESVCSTCIVKRELFPRAGATHLASCVPYCAMCYYRWLMSRRWDELQRKPLKECKGHEKGDDETVSVSQSLLTISGQTVEKKSVRICKDCAKLRDEEIYEVTDKREKSIFKELAYRLKCEVCFKEVGGKRGLCWWICSTCSAVCRWNGHRDIEGGVPGSCCNRDGIEMV